MCVWIYLSFLVDFFSLWLAFKIN
uniref:Uncharacterized protein n=1 Tax=Rhizophora mucronata TaxID=61149 RepID=A0A2P2QI18_RHIMU